MKKLVLLSCLLCTFLVTIAQTSKKNSKNNSDKSAEYEALMQVRIDSLQTLRQLRIDSALTRELISDSIRKENERLAEIKFQAERQAWIENREREADSIDQQIGKSLSKDHEQRLLVENQRAAVNRSVKLSSYQNAQVNYINQTAFEKAKKISSDPAVAEQFKKQELSKLNIERRNSIRTIVGRSKEQKLEKARKAQKNVPDTEAQWIDEVEIYAKN